MGQVTGAAESVYSTEMMRWRAAAVWIVVLADLAFVLLGAILIPEQANLPLVLFPIVAVMVASFGFVGALVVTRRRRNPVGWIVWAMATVITVSTIGQVYVGFSMGEFNGTLPGTVALAWLSNAGFIPALWIVVVFIPLLFPDGRLISSRWRWVAAFDVVATLAFLVPSALTPGPLGSFNGTLGSPLIQNPLGIAGVQLLNDVAGLLTVPMTIIALPLAVASSVVRYRRGSPTERQQLKWFASAIAFTAASLVLSIPGSPVSEIGWYVTILSFALIPIAIGIAVLRYRLYEIDVIIRRALVYVPLTAIIAGIYAASVALSQRLLTATGQNSDMAIVLTTLIVVVVFTPIKNAVQAAVDRRFKEAPSGPMAAVGPPTKPIEPTDLLRELAQLRSEGILTDAEFDAKKLEVLARL